MQTVFWWSLFIFYLFHLAEAATNLNQSTVMWVWLMDMERACALLIGRCLGGMLIGSPLSVQEKQAEPWLSSHLFSNGLQMCAQDIGILAQS